MTSLDYKPNKRTGKLEPKMTPEEMEKLRTAFDSEQQIESDPNAYFDDISDPFDALAEDTQYDSN